MTRLATTQSATATFNAYLWFSLNGLHNIEYQRPLCEWLFFLCLYTIWCKHHGYRWQDWLLRSLRLLRLTPIFGFPLMVCTILSIRDHCVSGYFFCIYTQFDASIIGIDTKNPQSYDWGLWYSILSGWQDSNLRPHAPQTCTLTGLSYIPKNFCGAKIITFSQLMQINDKKNIPLLHETFW